MKTILLSATENQTVNQTRTSRLPLAVKLGFTAFMAVLVPIYWVNYGPTNFLYFCDVALFLTLIAVWTEHPLPASMAAVGILIPQAGWVIDFICGFAGFHPIGLTAYMFDSSKPLYARGLSLFHGWLPFMLVYLVAKLGYDRRALKSWTLVAWTVMLISYFFLPGPTTTPPADAPVNVNYVHGFSDTEPQKWMNPQLFFATLMTALPLIVYLPTHLVLRRFAPAASR